MEFKKYLIFIIVIFVLLSCKEDNSNINENDKIVARLNEVYIVTKKDLNQYVKDWKYDKRFRVKAEAYKNALKGLIRDRLRVFDFFERRLNENQDLMGEIRRNINFELINTFFDKNFVNEYANEKTALEVYKQMDKEVICIDIILKIPEKPTKEAFDSLKAIALKIETGLTENYDIQSIIRHNSLKNILLNTERKITWSETMSDPIANVIFRLQKGFTRVIESVDGTHIVKVLDIKKIKLEPFEKIKDEIVSHLQNGFYNEYNNAYDEFRNGLIDKKTIKWNKNGLDQIVKWSSEDESFYGGPYKDTIEKTISNGNNFEILSYKKGSVDLKEYLRLLEEIINTDPNLVLTSVSAKELITDALYDNNVVEAAKENGLEEKLVNPYTQNNRIADRLLYLYNQSVIEGSIPEATPEVIYRFYEDHKDSIFYQLKIAYIYARIYSDSAKAAADINEIKKGTPFEKVSNSWLVKMFIRERDGTCKAYKTYGGDYLAEAAVSLSLNEYAGPIEYTDSTNGKQYAVIKCFQIQPEKQLTFDEVKGKRIDEEFKNYYRQKITEEVDARLKKKYSIEIMENVLSETIASQ